MALLDAEVPIIRFSSLDELWEALPDALAGKIALLYQDPMAPAAEQSRLPSHVAPPNTALIVETSGSTGNPKRVLLSAAALKTSAQSTEKKFGAGQWILTLPLNYIAGILVVIRSFLRSLKPLDCSDFSAAQFFETITSASAQGEDTPLFVSFVPYQLQQILDFLENGESESSGHAEQSLYALQNFRAILVGGQSTPPDLKRRAESLKLPIVATYGSTETSGGFAYNGQPFQNTEIQLRDEELLVTGPTLSHGYWHDAERTNRAFVQIGGRIWYRTGDRAEITPEGTIRILGRFDDVFISGGIKVSSHELTEVVHSIAGLQDALVVVAPHPQWGEAPVIAFDGRLRIFRPTLEEVRAAVESRLGVAAKPAALVPLPTGIPMLANGKPDMKLLKQLVHEFLTQNTTGNE